MKILIVEDNYKDMYNISCLIKDLMKDCYIFRAGYSKDALHILVREKIDIILIDVMLPDVDGFKLAKLIRNIPEYKFLKLVFITAKEVDQLKIFKYFHCYDYIVKPFSVEQFNKTMKPLIEGFSVLKNESREQEKMVFIKIGAQMILVPFDDIYFAEATGRKIRLATAYQTFENVDSNLHKFIQDVNHQSFRKCHKSYAVNITNIRKIQKRSGRVWDIYFTDQIFCPLSKTFLDEIITEFKQNGC